MSTEVAFLELDDIQKGVLQPRPSPYAGSFRLLRIDDRRDGRELLHRLITIISTNPSERDTRPWVSVAITFEGLKVLGVPQESLDSFPFEFRQGMAARAEEVGDVGVDAPANWERPLGSRDVHVLLAALAPDKAQLDAAIAEAQTDYEHLTGVKLVWRQECHSLPGDCEAFGFRDGIAHPPVEGSGIPGSNPKEEPVKAGEFVLGYPDETNNVPRIPRPAVLGRNGTFVAFRKLNQDVAAFRRYVRANASSPAEEELLAAKFVGRWRSGCPLSVSPDRVSFLPG
jgi:deferrochelatase/peroxidase EfeB